MNGGPTERFPARSVHADGPLVRPYALVAGRTQPSASLPVEAVVRTRPDADLSGLRLERAAIARSCMRPKGVVEVAARLRIPVAVVRVMVGDLRDEGVVEVHLPPASAIDVTDSSVLDRVLAGLHAL